MDEELFKELTRSVREMKDVENGKKKPARRTVLKSGEITRVRQNMGLSQSDFASLMGISPRTLQNWEQGHRQPTGSACVLLRVARKDPAAVLAAVRE